MTAWLIAGGCLVLPALIWAGLAHYIVRRERRDELIRDRDARKWGLRAFDQGKEKRL